MEPLTDGQVAILFMLSGVAIIGLSYGCLMLSKRLQNLEKHLKDVRSHSPEDCPE